MLPTPRRSLSRGSARAALLDAARELREGEDRHLELAGQLLQAAADVGHLLDAVVVLVRRRRLHQLEVVDDDQVEPVLLRLKPSRLRAQLHHRERRRVVDPHRWRSPCRS